MIGELADAAATAGLDGVLLYADGTHRIPRPSYLEYAVGVTPIADENALVVAADGRAALVVDLPRDAGRVARHSGIDDVRANRSFGTALVDALADLGVGSSLGVAESGLMPRGTHDRLVDAVGSIEAVDDAVDDLVRPKDAAERSTFRTLARIADAGFEAVLDALAPGVKEYELAAAVEHAMRTRGAEDNFNLFGTGQHNQLMHAPTDRVIREGDVVLCELSPVVDGRVLQICRTVSVGTPDELLTSKYALLDRALEETKACLSVGSPAGVVARTMNAVFREAGYAEYCEPPYMRTRGHEFGAGPIGMSITEETETPLQEGMVLVVHPNQYVPEVGYLALGDSIMVTDDGVETLTGIDARLFTTEVV